MAVRTRKRENEKTQNTHLKTLISRAAPKNPPEQPNECPPAPGGATTDALYSFPRGAGFRGMMGMRTATSPVEILASRQNAAYETGSTPSNRTFGEPSAHRQTGPQWSQPPGNLIVIYHWSHIHQRGLGPVVATYVGAPDCVEWSCVVIQRVCLVASTWNDGIYYSDNAGSSWTKSSAPENAWKGISASADGTRIAACIDGGGIWLSADSGQSWREASVSYIADGVRFEDITMAADGSPALHSSKERREGCWLVGLVGAHRER